MTSIKALLFVIKDHPREVSIVTSEDAQSALYALLTTRYGIAQPGATPTPTPAPPATTTATPAAAAAAAGSAAAGADAAATGQLAAAVAAAKTGAPAAAPPAGAAASPATANGGAVANGNSSAQVLIFCIAANGSYSSCIWAFGGRPMCSLIPSGVVETRSLPQQSIGGRL